MLNKTFELFCQWFGFLFILLIIIVLNIRVIVYLWHLCPPKAIKSGVRENTWAVITGATDGIGLSYAKQLAEKGYNLLLISRNEQKLYKVKEDFDINYGSDREVRTLAIDFNDSSESTYETIEQEFKNLDEIQVLVNNVGVCYPNESPEYLTQIPNLNEVIMSLINVNVIASTRLIALVLPDMERRRRGIIINLSSFSAVSPVPLLALYSATKVYIDYMSRALQEEYRHKGIVIQSVIPFLVSTQMAHNMTVRSYAPTPDEFVRQALNTVGREDRTAGYSVHKLLRVYPFVVSLISNCIGIDLNIKILYRRSKAIRDRIHEKKEQFKSFKEHIDEIV